MDALCIGFMWHSTFGRIGHVGPLNEKKFPFQMDDIYAVFIRFGFYSEAFIRAKTKP